MFDISPMLNQPFGTFASVKNVQRIMYRLYRPDGRLYGTGSDTGSFWASIDEAKKAREKSGIKDLQIHEYDTQLQRIVAEIMV